MIMRLTVGGAAFGLCAASVWQIIDPPDPRIIYNKSDSAPVGWYLVDRNATPEKGDLVAAFAPEAARTLAHERGYLPRHAPLIKTIWATSGDEICAENGAVFINGRPTLYAALADRLGRPMPQLSGCFALKSEDVFLVSTDVQTSFDSRYFGAVPAANIIGVVHYMEKAGADTGGPRGERQ